MIRQLLKLEQLDGAARAVNGSGRTLFISINPDLVSDFGHFLNYELRIEEQCERLNLDYLCFANTKISIARPTLLPVFEADSGYFALTRLSARGKEDAIVEEFHRCIDSALTGRCEQYETVIIFVYCGSSLLASRLSYIELPPNVKLVVNSFWDFLMSPDKRDYAHLYRLKFQSNVQMLAMSELHAGEIARQTGLHFEACSNPPPLLGDGEAYARIRAMTLCHSPPPSLLVLVPGLMTSGKGMDATTRLFSACTEPHRCGVPFCFRDRGGRLPGPVPDWIEVIQGDLTDEQVVDLYLKSSIAILPYETPTFAVRTSGALVDCLMFGVVPIVLEGTWLADVCRCYGFGAVVDTCEPGRIFAEINRIKSQLAMEMGKVSSAAVQYFNDHNWSTFVSRASGGAIFPKSVDREANRASSLFAAGNLFHRMGRHQEAIQVYMWLSTMSEFSEYIENLKRSKNPAIWH